MVAGRYIGKKALVIGAVAQSLPDIDFIAAGFLSMSENLLAHRGITHSLFFLLVMAPLLAYLGWRIWKGQMQLNRWLFLISLELLVHLLLDSMNNYGMGLLEPFSSERIALHVIFVADPLFTIIPVVAVIILFARKSGYGRRRFIANTALVVAGFYLGLCIYNKIRIESAMERSYMHQGIAYEQKLTTPTPFNNLLWFSAAGGQDGFFVGYRSIFDGRDSTAFQFFPRNQQLEALVEDRNELDRLKTFSQGFYTLEQWGDTIVFNDLRFGQVAGWHNPSNRFVFHYYLGHPDAENRLVVQRGRFAGWNRETLSALFRKIGNSDHSLRK